MDPEDREAMTDPFGRRKMDVILIFGEGEPVVVRKSGARETGMWWVERFLMFLHENV
jgi:hypothetical protein